MPLRHVTVADHHKAGYTGPYWIACEHPERPLDGWSITDFGCDACMIALVVATTTNPAYRADRFDSGRATKHGNRVEILESARQWRADRGLRAI